MRGSRRQSAKPADGFEPEPFLPCPILTDKNCLADEEEIRAYKLGKKRWSYNQCALEVRNADTEYIMEVADCMQYGAPTLTESQQQSGVTYQIRFRSGYRARLNIFAVYNQPRLVEDIGDQVLYEWPCVTRAGCSKTCMGPILRTIQRFGKLGRRSGKNQPKGSKLKEEDNAMKEAKHMFVSIDEAGSHVNFRQFRLVAGMYSIDEANTFLGSTISQPVRVLANNDVPTGAAFINLKFSQTADWIGFQTENKRVARLPAAFIAMQDRKKPPLAADNSHSSNETEYSGGHLRRRQDFSWGAVLVQHAHHSLEDDGGAHHLQNAFAAVQQSRQQRQMFSTATSHSHRSPPLDARLPQGDLLSGRLSDWDPQERQLIPLTSERDQNVAESTPFPGMRGALTLHPSHLASYDPAPSFAFDPSLLPHPQLSWGGDPVSNLLPGNPELLHSHPLFQPDNWFGDPVALRTMTEPYPPVDPFIPVDLRPLAEPEPPVDWPE